MHVTDLSYYLLYLRTQTGRFGNIHVHILSSFLQCHRHIHNNLIAPNECFRRSFHHFRAPLTHPMHNPQSDARSKDDLIN